MKISLNFLPKGPNASPEEAHSVAKIKIEVGGKIVTDLRIDDQRTIVDHVVAPAYPLAEAIAFRWWQILYGRGRKINLRTLGSGFAYPDVSFGAIGNGQIEINCRPYVYDNPKVQFVNFSHESTTVDDCSDEFETFIMTVLDQVEASAATQTALTERFEKIQNTLADDEEAEFCRAAGAFGADPYTCTEEVAALIESASKLFDEDGLEEFLAGAQYDGAKSLEWLLTSEATLGELTELPRIEEMQRGLGFRRRASAPWTEGYASARKVRSELGLKPVDSLKNSQNLATLFGNPRFRSASPGVVGLRGASHIVPGHARVIVSPVKYQDAEFFAVARTLGDALHFGSDHYSPVTSQVGTYRQQLGRAFAAELLAPAEAVLDMQDEGRHEDDIAQHFGVADELIRRQSENASNSL